MMQILNNIGINLRANNLYLLKKLAKFFFIVVLLLAALLFNFQSLVIFILAMYLLVESKQIDMLGKQAYVKNIDIVFLLKAAVKESKLSVYSVEDLANKLRLDELNQNEQELYNRYKDEIKL